MLVQEAPRLVLWRTSRWLLARRAGLRVATWRWAAGDLVLVAPSVTVHGAGSALLPRRPGLHRRAVAWADVTVRGRRLTAAATHLDLQPEARLDSARRVRALLPPGPLVLGADLNDKPGSPTWEALSDGLAGGSPGPTFPSSAPRRRIDALLTNLAVLRLEAVDTGSASDHLAVLAELDLPVDVA